MTIIQIKYGLLNERPKNTKKDLPFTYQVPITKLPKAFFP